TESWFINRGLPHLIEGYSARTDILTRAAPLLTIVFLFEALGALNFEAWWANTLAVAGAFGFVVTAWALINRSRGRRALEPPQSIGAIELGVFLFVPALVPLVFGGNVLASLGIVALNLAILAVIYLGTSYALVPIALWATGRLFRQLVDTIRLFARAVPLLLLFVTFLFINAEVWQMASRLFGPLFVATIALFTGFGALFALVRLPKEVEGLGRFESWERVDELCRETPAHALQPTGPVPPEQPLRRRQWINVGLVILFGQALQVLLVAVLVGAFLVLLGVVALGEGTITSWVGTSPNILWTLTWFGRTVQVTEELLRVAGFLAAFSGLYFAVTAVTDANYRAEFFEEVVGDVREAFAARALYLDARGVGSTEAVSD
ncbi:MAG: hypothetical protein OEM97_01355, partial [Acidimicrobiia bacterium]|nr:hypothetical protein [Acidimicrobiia bacterium]